MTNKTFYITYWASKHKKHITRKGKHDDKSRYGVAKNGTPYYVYYDLDSHGYRTTIQPRVVGPLFYIRGDGVKVLIDIGIG